MSDLIVIRGTGGARDGWWFDRETMPKINPRDEAPLPPGAEEIECHPTGLLEVRDDGAVGEIFAPHPGRVSE